MRRTLVPSATAVLALGCAPGSHTSLAPVPPCTVPSSAVPFDTSRVEDLAGEYALVLVADSFPSPGARTAGRLRLRVNGDSQRLRERPLVGSLEINLDAIFAPYSRDPGSPDPNAPGVYFDWASHAFQIGVQPNLADGTSTSLTPTLTWPEGFSGRWSPDYGIASIRNAAGKPAHVGGTFCAARNRK